ncbi:MAG: lamin tail domain-containing protein [Christensenellales bacterium]
MLQSGALVINEICASSITTLKDEDGDYPDWIEIHNTTNQAIDLSNYALSDSTRQARQVAFSAGQRHRGERLFRRLCLQEGSRRSGGKLAARQF